MTTSRRPQRIARLLVGIAAASFGVLLGSTCVTEDGGATATAWGEAFDAKDVGWLLSVWGPGDSQRLYAAGGSPDKGLILASDTTTTSGSGWGPVTLGVDVPLLNWVHGLSADDVVVVGTKGTAVHRSGGAWSLVGTPTDQDLWGVWGASSNDLWAVGGNGREAGQATILRYDGTRWSAVAVPTLQRPNVFAFFKVWGTSADNVYIVGQRGAVLRWNGSQLEEILIGFDGAAQDLIALWGTGPDRIAVVGGRNNGVIARWDGATWRVDTVAPLPGLNGVWMRDPDTIHVVGVQGTIAAFDFDTLKVDETTTDVFDDFHAIFGDSRGRLTTVGGNFISQKGPYRGVAWQRTLGSGE